MKYNKIYGKTVLVADDVEINRKIITKLISALGGKAVCATNGHDAVKLFKVSSEGEYSIVLMDICMPIMNGYEASAAIRMSEHPDAKNIPMVPEWRLQMMANTIFRSYLLNKQKVLELANEMLEAHINDTEETEDYSAILESKTEEYQKLNKRLDNYVEMRADGEITKEIFHAKTMDIENQMEKLRVEIDSLSQKTDEPEITDYREKITVLQYALEQYRYYLLQNPLCQNPVPVASSFQTICPLWYW